MPSSPANRPHRPPVGHHGIRNHHHLRRVIALPYTRCIVEPSHSTLLSTAWTLHFGASYDGFGAWLIFTAFAITRLLDRDDLLGGYNSMSWGAGRPSLHYEASALDDRAARIVL